MKCAALAVVGLMLLAAAVSLWIFAKMVQVVLILGVIGLVAVCIGVILFNNNRVKKIRRSDER